MTYVKWILIALIFTVVASFLHYTLPQRDIVQIVGTDVKRVDVAGSWTSIFWASADAGQSKDVSTRDVRFVNAQLPNGDPYVFRNEDTEWSWPPYLKFDSGNLTAQAQALAKRTDTTWVAVTHYGWRIKIISIFPNAIKIREVDGPDALLIPWFNIVFFIVLAVILFAIFRAIRKFKMLRIDPVIENFDEVMDDVGEGADKVQEKAEAAQKGAKAWFKRWFG